MSRTQWYIGAPNGVVVCVHRADGEGIAGSFYHSYSPDPVPFRNLEQLVLGMERLYDRLNFPHPANSERTFGEERRPAATTIERKKIMSDESLLRRHGDIGTFIVRVQHRQNSSWQGRITWMEEDRTIQFRSIWEMIKLIESAVDTVSHPEGPEETALTWFDDKTDGE